MPPAGFSSTGGFSAAEKESVRKLLAAQGIRPMPFLFSSGFAIASDLDATSRQRYDGYIGELVKESGLDFGDSTWLAWQYLNRRLKSNSLGFFSRYLTMGRNEKVGLYTHTRTFFESVAEFHVGNVDHFHSFSSRGPRVSIFTEFSEAATGDGIEVICSKFQNRGFWRCDDLFVFGICVVGVPGAVIDVKAVTVRNRKGEVFADYARTDCNPPENGREHRLFTLQASADADTIVPQLDEVERIHISFGEPVRANLIERVMVLGTHGELVIDRLKFLKDRYNVELSLITDHGGLHFRNPRREIPADKLLKERVCLHKGPAEAYNGRLTDDDGQVIFSTDSDDPVSFCRVFPEISRDLEVRFIVPHPASQAWGYDPLELVTPSPTRSGGGIYWVRRVFPPVGPPVSGRKFDGHSRRDTFSERVLRILDDVEVKPGLLWPMYTHLGSLARDEPDENDADPEDDAVAADREWVPSPYLDKPTLARLQDHVFGISGDAASRPRVWFTRATVLYDYALIVQSVAPHVHRPDENTIRISSWFDPVLGKMLPRSPGQLYGLTFYVEDPAKARVLLDSKPLNVLVRNARDETGRYSVTVAESDIRYVLIGRLNPLANSPQEALLEGGKWQWIANTGEKRPFGRLTIAGNLAGTPQARGTARLSVPLHGWAPTGSQLMVFSIVIDDNVKFGFIFKTRTGGTFYFGDRALPTRPARNVTASYFFPPRYRAPNRLHVLTVPFHDLIWSEQAKPGGPMPNHVLTSFTIVIVGPEGSGIRVGGLEFLRPRCVADNRSDERLFCLGGRVAGYRPGQAVTAMAEDQNSGPGLLETSVDQRGYFSFGRVPAGLYCVRSKSDDRDLFDRRGPLVDVSSDIMNLVLGQPARDKTPINAEVIFAETE